MVTALFVFKMHSENGTESSLIDAQRNIENAFQLIESVSDSEDRCNNKLKSILSDADINLKKAAYEMAYKTSFGVENLRKLLAKEDVLLLRRNNNIFGKAEDSRKHPQTQHEQSDTVDVFPLSNVSPGEKMQLEMALKILSDPSHRFNREMLHSTYGVQLPTLDSSDQMEKAAVESTAKDPVHLSQIEDRSKQMKPKLICLDHVELGTGGTLDLFQRGYIPSNAVIRFDPPLIRSRKAYLHNAHERSIRPMLSLEDKPLCPVYKAFSESEPLQGQKAEKRLFRNIDPQQKDRKILAKNKAIVSNIAAGDQQKLAITSGQHTTEDSPPSTHEVKSPKQNSTFLTEQTDVGQFNLRQPPTTPIENASLTNEYWINIQNGVVLKNSTEFINFRQQYRVQWKKILRVMQALECLFEMFALPEAVVNGARMVDIAIKYANCINRVSHSTLLTCVKNAQELSRLMMQPGRRFRGKNGPALAAVVIQKHFRRHRTMKQCKEYKRQLSAANVICRAWRRTIKLRKIHELLTEVRKQHVEESYQRLLELGKNWEQFELQNHVIIHIPSMGCSAKVRRNFRDVGEMEYVESRQIARLCEIRNASTDVIYISRSPISDDLLEYYRKLLGLGNAIRTGSAKDQEPVEDRYRILVPEAVEYFQYSTAPPLCLSSLLKYSPRALNHIQKFIAGRPALIVPGLDSHPDDFAVAHLLKVPVWAARPNVTHLFFLQSTAKRIIAQIMESHNTDDADEAGTNIENRGTIAFALPPTLKQRSNVKDLKRKVLDSARSGFGSAGAGLKGEPGITKQTVAQPPGDYNMFTLEHLYESLAELITAHLPTKYWLLKIDDCLEGHGTAKLCADQLRSFTWAIEQRQWYGPARWAKRWAQEASYLRILTEVPEWLHQSLYLCSTKIYPNAQSFVEAFIESGGVIEACPPTNSWTNITVYMAVMPNGQSRLLASGDQIRCGNEFCAWGLTVPMSSVDPYLLNFVCNKVSKYMTGKKFFGHFKIDLVTFLSPETHEQVLWVTGIRPGYADGLAMIQLTLFAIAGTFIVKPDTGAHQLFSECARDRDCVKDTKLIPSLRYAVVSSRLWHTNLALLQYAVFFQICRANYIGYSLKDRRGILFTPIDSYRREFIGMVAVAENLSEALRLSVRTLEPLHKEVSSPSSPGANNFQMAIKELQNVSQQVADNQADSERNRSSTENATQLTKRISGPLEQRSRRRPDKAAPKERTRSQLNQMNHNNNLDVHLTREDEAFSNQDA